MNDQSNSQNELNRVLEKIQEIVEKAADGDYIYRGESEHYEKVSSSLYREYPLIEGETFDIEVAQIAILEEAKTFTDKTDSVEILTEIQHFGGKTNFIDFTKDYLIALFFACDGSHEKPGRIILLKKGSKDYELRKPRKTVDRVESQKSIFVKSPNGFVEADIAIDIPVDLKLPMLDYLRKYHRISVEFVYNDLHGFIRRSAYTEFLKGLTCQRKMDEVMIKKEKENLIESSIKHFSEALKLKPNFLVCYLNRGKAYRDKGELDKAIQDYNKALELDPEFTDAYNGRGNSYLLKGELNCAIADYNKAIDLTPDDPLPYNNRGNVYLRKGELEQSIQTNNSNGFSSNVYFDNAITDYKKAIGLKPDYAKAYCNLGTVYRETGEFETAIEKLTKAIELDSKLVFAYYNRGQTWLLLHEWEKATQDLTIAKDLDHKNKG